MVQQPSNHDYYYGNEADQYTFYRLPKALFTDNRYKNLSDSAKILYGLMLDRMGLSIRNGWMDRANRVYIYFTLDDLQEYMNCGHNKGVKIMTELDNIGLIERVKQGQGRAAIIYVKKFFVTDDRISQEDKSDITYRSYPQEFRSYSQGNPDFPKAEVKTSEKGKSRLPITGSADFLKADANNTNINNTKSNDTDDNENNPIQIQSYPKSGNSSVPQIESRRLDGIREINAYREMIKDNIEYDSLCYQYGKERIDEIVELLTDTVCSKREYICISSNDYPKEAVKSRLLKLDQFHVEYVLDSIDKNTTKVNNIKKYMLASFFNAPTTIDTYYRAEVNHDMYRRGT